MDRRRRRGGRQANNRIPAITLAKIMNKCSRPSVRYRGLTAFYFPPLEGGLKAAAESGPIVIINVSKYRCDALMIETSQIRVLPLASLRYADIVEYSTTVNMASLNVLKWLWECIARPVLDALGLFKTPAPEEDHWPRVWWIPTGLLARFPIHAAGCHSKPGDSVIDCVISSFSSTVQAIISGRHDIIKPPLDRPQHRHCHSHGKAPEPDAVVIIGMQTTPGQADLRYASEEADILQKPV